jgi:hypothetical protein
MNQISFIDFLLKIPTSDLLIIFFGLISILYWCDVFETDIWKSIWFWICFVFQIIFIIAMALITGEDPYKRPREDDDDCHRHHHRHNRHTNNRHREHHHHHTEDGHIIKPDIIIDPSHFMR